MSLLYCVFISRKMMPVFVVVMSCSVLFLVVFSCGRFVAIMIILCFFAKFER